MSAVHVRAALEAALQAITPSIATAFENDTSTPPAPATPYQRVNVLFSTPANLENTASYEERGFMQVTLCYPLKTGPGGATARAELIRAAFPRGRNLTAGGVITLIPNTPEIMPGFVDGDRFCVPVRIRFSAQISV